MTNPTLAELCTLIADSEHKTAPKDLEGQHPLVRTTDLGNARVDLARAQRVNADTYGKWTRRGEPRTGDLILAREAPVGGIACVPEDVHPVLGQRTVLLRPGGAVDSHYLMYRLAAGDLQARMNEMATGSTVPHLNMSDIRAFEIPELPALAVQKRRAAVLSAFDELIAINERRIELLEDLARSLYREWFVRFRFPGSSGGFTYDRLPHGWEKRPAKASATFVNGYAFKPSDWSATGRPIIKIKELKQGISDATPRYEGGGLPAKFLVGRGDLLFSWSAHLGVYLWPDEPGYLNQHLFKVTPSDGLPVEFLFHALDAAMPEFDARAQGTTMRHIKRSALTEVELLVPTRAVAIEFRRLIAPLHESALVLAHAKHALAQARDLLLPRLVTGRLDISDVDVGDLLPNENAA